MEGTNENDETPVAELVKIQCEKAFPSSEFVEVIDESDGCGAKLLVTIVSDEAFNKVPLIKRHRKVQNVLKDAGFGMDVVHAVTIRAWTVLQWEKKKATA